MFYYNEEYSEVLKTLNSNKNGLNSNEVEERLKKHGYNELNEKNKVSLFKLFVYSFKDLLVIILIMAGIIQIILGEQLEAIIIFAVIIINAILGVWQTKKAEGSINSLKKLSAPNAKVVRNSSKINIPAKELVVGDIVLLEAGDYVPADGRIIEAQTLKIEEGMLTGESEPVLKTSEKIDKNVSLGDQINMVFSGSMVVNGRGIFVVTQTGMNTQIGLIASMIENAEEKSTPLQIKLDEFSKKFGIGIIILAIIIFFIEVTRAYISGNTNMVNSVADSFMFAIALAVAAIPEALSSIVTIVLSVGTNDMAKNNVIIRKLPAVETLGATSVICTDKTGTLTQNKMTVVDGYIYNMNNFKVENSDIDSLPQVKLLATISSLCNDSSITKDGEEIGDPTEIALLYYTSKNNLNYNDLRNKLTRLEELPFDSDRKLMSTLNNINGEYVMLTKGAPDVVFNRCDKVLVDGKPQEFTEEMLDSFKNKNEKFSNEALRVLAFASKRIGKQNNGITIQDENNLTLVGLLAMIDLPRLEVIDSIKEAKDAGVKTVMITGDHKTTAVAIARKIGIYEDGNLALTGEELDNLSEKNLDEELENVRVYARVSPENKIRIVNAWQKKNTITAMTGDGVNDAPSLKQADIGIGMGSGTDVAKDSSDMILLDDNFTSIVKAVEVGRTVYGNIKKSITYLFAGNLAAIEAILFAVVFGWENPFTAIQLLFINLVNDSLPAIALGFEKTEKSIMNYKPRDPDEPILSNSTLKIIAFRGTTIAIVTIIAQWIGMRISPSMGTAMAYSTLILSRTIQTIPARSNTQIAFRLGFFSNKYVIGTIVTCMLLYGFSVLPMVKSIFAIPSEFGIISFLICLLLALISSVIMELNKLVGNIKNR